MWPMWPNVAKCGQCGQCGQSWRNTTREIFAIKGLRDLKLPHQYRGMIDYPMMHSLSAVVSLMDFPRLSVTTLLWPMWPMWPNVAECGRMWPRMWPARSRAHWDSREFFRFPEILVSSRQQEDVGMANNQSPERRFSARSKEGFLSQFRMLSSH